MTTNPENQSNQTDQHTVRISNLKLNGDNFHRWSLSVRLYIRGRGKIGYLTGEKKEPDRKDAEYATWEAENSMVMAWLTNSMEEDISATYLGYSTAKELWDNLTEMYSDLGNQSQIYELQLKLGELKQGNETVTKYFSAMKRLWQELDIFKDYTWKDPSDAAHYQKEVDNSRVYSFLAGLNVEFDEVRSRIIGRRPLSSLNEVFAEVRREESRRSVMLGKKEPVPASIETSALVSQENTALKAAARKPEDKKKVWCDYCHRPRHTRETCWKLNGKPENWKARERSFPNANSAEQVSLTKEQIDQLLKLVNHSSTPNCSLVHTGNLSTSFLSLTDHTPWIIDSGASDHMTSMSSLFHTYIPCPGNKKVRLADGSFTPIAGKGSVKISNAITLESVLHVPNLSCNLLSVSKLSRNSNCLVIFSPQKCVFQDRNLGKEIGSAREDGGLYYFGGKDQAVGLSCDVNSLSIREQIMTWHYRLGHPSFPYLKHLFPVLFQKLKNQYLHCDICSFSKSTRQLYNSKPYRASKPFYLIHSDVWGPCNITSLSGKRWFVTFIDDHTRLCWVYLMKQKSEVQQLFKIFYNMVETQFQTKISILRTDNGKEYFNQILGQFLLEKGIQHQSSCGHTPQQNGVAERKNRHLLEVSRALMLAMNVPHYLWGDAVLTAAYLINRVPSRVLNHRTPLSCLKEFFPDNRLHSNLPLKVFGCTVFVHITDVGRSKLAPKAEKCVFIGYATNQKGYKVFNPKTKKIQVSMDVVFLEQQPFFENHLQGEKYNRVFEDEAARTGTGTGKSFQDQTSTGASSPVPYLPHLPSVLDKPIEINPADQTISLSQNLPTTGGDTTSQVLNEDPTTEIQVYTRRRHQNNRDHPSTQGQSQSANPMEPGLELHNTGNPSITIEPNFSSQTNSGPTVTESNTEHNTRVFDTDLDIPIAIRKGVRSCTNHPIAKYMSYHKLSSEHKAFTSKISHLSIPRNIQEALECPKWKEAVMEEMNALVKNNTWESVVLPREKKAVGCKWVFTVKCKADGSIERYKARLVAKGFTQTHGLDYQETFAPVAKVNSIRILFSLAANCGWSLHQLDVKNAFLNGYLDEEVFMEPPPGFEHLVGRGRVCKLIKSIYGLKQSPRAWFERFGEVVRKLGYRQSQGDHTLFVKHSSEGKRAVLIVYVDDIILTGDDDSEIDRLKKLLAKEFEVKDLGEAKYFLGMEITRSEHGISVCQRKYVLDLLGETGMLGCRAAETPMEPNLKVEASTPEELVDKEQYQKLVGKLIYLAHTRPDITFAVGVVSQFMHSPGQKHHEAVVRILRYLKGTPGKGLFFANNGHFQVDIYTDADWAGDITDRRSTSGYCTFVCGNLVTWRSKKQNVVARSSAEAEYRAVALGICEGLWMRQILEDLNIKLTSPIKLYCDNKSAIAIAHNPVLHDRTKHVEIDKHFIKEKIDKGQICMTYLPTAQQVADILTKSLPRRQFDELVSKLEMRDIFKPA